MVWFLGWRRRYRPRRSIRRRVVYGFGKVAAVLVLLSILLTACFRWIDPPTSSFMLQSWFAAHSKNRDDYRLRHYWVDWDEISTSAKVAVIASEDQRFLRHAGFDLESIADALYDRIKKNRHRGASTISQQVAKNLFLWPGQSLVRKGLEAYFTLLIESFWPKQRVLEVYLNVAQFGDGVFGIEAASVHFFHKSAADLRPVEAATLAAVLPNPIRYRVDRPTAFVQKRSRWILSQIRALGGAEHLRKLPEG